MALGTNPITTVLRWWFYQHGRFCAKHPIVAAVIGIFAVLASTLGLFNPRGQPFVFRFEGIQEDFVSWFTKHAIPRWYIAAYMALAVYIAVAADNGVKYSTLKRIRSVLGLNELERQGGKRPVVRKPPAWSPPFIARFVVGLCGVLTILFSIVISVAVSHSLLGVAMDNLFDELPLLIVYVGVQGVFSLLDASTETFSHSEKRTGGQVYVVDRVNQLAMATSLTGPEDFLIALSKASLGIVGLLPLRLWLGSYGQALGDFCVHAGMAVLAKYLLQMSVFASIVQALVPFWDPHHAARSRLQNLITPEAKCRVCLDSSSDLRRCPCKCSGSVGFIHPVCFQQWFECKKSMRCELCHVVFQVRMLPTSVFTNAQSLESFIACLLPALVKRMVLYLAIMIVLLCNKLGLIVCDLLVASMQNLLGVPKCPALTVIALVQMSSPAWVGACVQVIPRVTKDWYRRHRVMHWDMPRSESSSGSASSESSDEDDNVTPSPLRSFQPSGLRVPALKRSTSVTTNWRKKIWSPKLHSLKTVCMNTLEDRMTWATFRWATVLSWRVDKSKPVVMPKVVDCAQELADMCGEACQQLSEVEQRGVG